MNNGSENLQSLNRKIKSRVLERALNQHLHIDSRPTYNS